MKKQRRFFLSLCLWLMAVLAMAQTQGKPGVTTGRVTDSNGEPLLGVTIMVEGSKLGVVTGANGDFSLTGVHPDDVLVFSYIGKKTQKWKVGTKPLAIILQNDENLVNDVVVIGYGSKEKRSLTSSISSLGKKEVETLAPTAPSIDKLFAGTVKGVRSIENSGEPGATQSLNIRGITSPYPIAGVYDNNNAPLFVIDGVAQFVPNNALNPLLALAPNDIESVDILKDASATAIYGSRGANGVIIVQTKNGRKGEKVSVEASYNISVGNAIKKYKPLNTQEFKQLQNEILSATAQYVQQTMHGFVDEGLLMMVAPLGNFDVMQLQPGMYMLNGYTGLNEAGFGTENTNWVDASENRNALTHRYEVAVRGGSETTNYAFSLNGSNQEGLFINDKLSRYGARLTLNTQINRHVKVGGTLNYAFSKRNSGSGPEGVVYGTEDYRVRPDLLPYDNDGNFTRIDETPAYGMPVMFANPLALRSLITGMKSYQFSGNAYFDAQIVKGLRLHGDLDVSTNAFENSYFTPSLALPEAFGEKTPANIIDSESRSTFTSINLRANYDNNFGDHCLGLMLGAGSDRTFYDGKSLSASDFANETVLHNIGSANIYDPITDSYVRGGLNSIYGRATYDYAKRYFAELSFRGDESSKFGPGNRWGYFPAVSLGWSIKDESFLRKVDPINVLKLRLSWGKTGSTNVSDFSYLQYFSKNGSYGGAPAIRLQSTLPNKDIKWEMTTEYNLGLDYALLNNRIYGSLDLYSRQTDGALTLSPYILESGMAQYYANLIDMSNKGVEFEIAAEIIKTKDFNWTSSFNIAANRNKVVHLNGANLNDAMQDNIVEGQPAGVTKGFAVERIIQTQEDLDALNAAAQEKGYPYFQDLDTGIGDYLFKDTNGDGHITLDDRVVIASPQPNFFGGWINSFTYKNLTLYAIMQFSQGSEAFYAALQTDLLGTLGHSVTREAFGNTWTPENTTAIYPRLVHRRMGSFFANRNDRQVFSTSYLRMKDITLTYTLPKSWLGKWLDQASIYASVTNLFTISNWPGLDPELTGSGIMNMASNRDPYPMSRTFTFGVNVKF